MNSLCSFPRVCQSLVCRGRDIRCNERIHSLCSYISSCLSCSSDLGYLGVEDPLLERVNFKCGKNIDFLDEQWRSILFSKFLGNLSQNSCRISVLVSFSVELDSLHLFVFLNQKSRISLKKLLDL